MCLDNVAKKLIQRMQDFLFIFIFMVSLCLIGIAISLNVLERKKKCQCSRSKNRLEFKFGVGGDRLTYQKNFSSTKFGFKLPTSSSAEDTNLASLTVFIKFKKRTKFNVPQ